MTTQSVSDSLFSVQSSAMSLSLRASWWVSVPAAVVSGDTERHRSDDAARRC